MPPGGGLFTGTIEVTIACATAGATIHYTTDGSLPTPASPTYAAPIPVSTTTTVTALAVAGGLGDSSRASETFTLRSDLLPTAVAGPDRYVIDTDGNGYEWVALDGSASTPRTGYAITSYVWREGQALVATSAVQTVPLGAGTHTLTLQVADSSGQTSTDDIVITVGPALTPGDADRDGDVDLDDFVILKRNFGAAPLADDRADFDGDGDADLDDFVILKRNFGS